MSDEGAFRSATRRGERLVFDSYIFLQTRAALRGVVRSDHGPTPQGLEADVELVTPETYV
jgi:hypothetical protein